MKFSQKKVIKMTEYPRITYKEPSYDIDEIFSKIDYNAPEELIKIRKKQISNHSQSYFIMEALDDLVNLIGKPQNNKSEIIMNMAHERLILLHSPVYLNIPANAEPYHKWDEWTFQELYEKYWDLAMTKGWENDYYTFNQLSVKSYFDNIKNYQVLDMLNDLVIHEVICGYEMMSFMDCDDNNKLLKSFKYNVYQDKVIHVKLNDKLSPKEWREYLMER